MKINKLLLGALVTCGAAGSTGAVIAVSSSPAAASAPAAASVPTVHSVDGSAPFAQDVAAVGASVKRAFPVIARGRSASDAASEQGLRNQLGAAEESDHGAIGLADFSLARS